MKNVPHGVAREAVEEILSHADGDTLGHLCFVADVAKGRTLDDRRRRLALGYGADVGTLIEDLRRRDLIDLLSDAVFDIGPRTFTLSRLHRAKLDELQGVTHAVFVDGWQPEGEGDRPLRHGTVCLLETCEDEEEWEAEDYEEENEQADLRPLGAPREHVIPDGLHDAVPLEDFQAEAVAALGRHFARDAHRSGALCLPTGGGKTRTALAWLLQRFIAHGERVLWVTHRLDLLDQVRDRIIEDRNRIRAQRSEGFVLSRFDGARKDLSGDFVLASAASLVASFQRHKPRAAPHFDIIVYDEAHRAIAGQTRAVLDHMRRSGEVPLLALTATPFRSDPEQTEELLRMVGEVVYQKSFAELIDRGFLATPRCRALKLGSTKTFHVPNDALARTRRAGDFDRSILTRLGENQERDREIVDAWQRQRETFGKTLVFACDIEHSVRLARAFERGRAAAKALHSLLSERERQSVLDWFKDSEDGVLVNVGMLTEGSDIPSIRTVLMARPTMSRALYEQMIGRGARGPKSVPGKTSFNIIDCVDNFDAHGLRLAGERYASEIFGVPVVRVGLLDEAVKSSSGSKCGRCGAQEMGAAQRFCGTCGVPLC